MKTKFCEFCGTKVAVDAVVCPKCGKQLEELKTKESENNPQVIINNTNSAEGVAIKKKCNKWTAFFLCLFLGVFGGHKFYEGKVGMGVLYIFTCGLLIIGVMIDLIVILCKPTTYYV